MKNLKLATCMRIFAKYDPDMAEYLSHYKEDDLNMSDVSAYARALRDANKITPKP